MFFLFARLSGYDYYFLLNELNEAVFSATYFDQTRYFSNVDRSLRWSGQRIADSSNSVVGPFVGEKGVDIEMLTMFDRIRLLSN